MNLMNPLKITDVRVLSGDSAFLIDDGMTSILYDTGFAFTGYAVADHVAGILGNRPLDFIFLTHSHYDHALGSAYLKKRFPDVKIVASAYAAGIFQKPSARAVMRDLDRKFAAECKVDDYEDLIDTLQADISVDDGDILICGQMQFQVIALPGHTKCSIGFYLKSQQLLLGTETLGVYFGGDTYLPSCLVGYQMTLDSLRRVRELDVSQILLPHYGLVQGEDAAQYLRNGEHVTRETAQLFQDLLRQGKTRDEILEYYTERFYPDRIRETYPIDAFRLNTSIMIDLIKRECL